MGQFQARGCHQVANKLASVSVNAEAVCSPLLPSEININQVALGDLQPLEKASQVSDPLRQRQHAQL